MTNYSRKKSFYTWLTGSQGAFGLGYAEVYRFLHGYRESDVDFNAVCRVTQKIESTREQIRTAFLESRASFEVVDALEELLLAWDSQTRIAVGDKAGPKREPLAPSLRFKILERDGFRCVYCGQGAADGVSLEVDHIVPVARSGRTREENLQTTCFVCNRGKGSRLI